MTYVTQTPEAAKMNDVLLMNGRFIANNALRWRYEPSSRWARECPSQKWPRPKNSANIVELSRIYRVTAMAFIIADQFQEEPTSQVLRIMLLSRLMLECSQSDTGWFAKQGNLLGTQPVRPQVRLQIAGQFSLIQAPNGLNTGSTGLRSGESPYPLRT